MKKIETFHMSHLDETVYRYKTAEGLRIHIMEKKNFSKKYAFFGTRYGSIDNHFTVDGCNYRMPEGIAHFLEHKLFEEETGDVFEIFSKAGARANAYTSHESTNYLFSCTDRFYENLETLIRFVQTLNIDAASVEKEKGIIKQEIIMYEDNPEWQAYMNALNLLYSEHPVRIDIAGTVESIQKIDSEMLSTCHRTFYSPENMIVFLIGSIDRFKAIETIERTLTEDFKNRRVSIERTIQEEKAPIEKEFHQVRLPVASPMFYMGIKCAHESENASHLLKKEIFMEIFLNAVLGKGSILYRDLYESGLISENFGYDYTYGPAYGHVIIGGDSREPEKTYGILKDALSKRILEKTGEADFNRIKKKMKGESLVYLNSLDYIANAYVSSHHKGIDFFRYFDELESFDYGTFLSFEERFELDGNMVLSTVYPGEEEVVV